MRILLMAQYYWPESVGAGIWIEQLAADLAGRGHLVTMVTAFPNYPEGRVFPAYRGRWFQRETRDGVRIIRTWIYATPSKRFWPRVASFGSFCASAIAGALAAPRPDVIYAILPPLPLGWSARLVARLRRVPYIANIQDMYPDIAVSLGYLRNRAAIAYFRRMARAIYRSAAAVTVIGEAFRRNLLAKGVPDGKIHVIPNWADAGAIQPGERDNAFRRQHNPDDRFLSVYSGGMGHNTSLDEVIAAAALLRAEPFRFLMIGDGVARKHLEEKARGLGLDNVGFLPFQPGEIYPEVLAASDAQLVALSREASEMSLPSKVLKIMASARPVMAVAEAASDLAGVVGQAGCGAVVPPGDAPALAEALREMARDPEGCKRMGEAGRSYLIRHYERSESVERIESVMAQAASRPRPRSLQWALKRLIEWTAATALLILTLPLQLLIALAIKLDSPGPVLFVQPRLGKDGKVFNIYKFRSMRWEPGAAARLNTDGSTRVDSDDARLTRLGPWLRMGWDELPQLWNIVRGDMALIGPRPDEPMHRKLYAPGEEEKLAVLPGITGLPQATGRTEIPWKRRIALDIDYIRNYSLRLDAKIAWRTLLLLLGGGNGPDSQKESSQDEARK